MCCPLDQIHQGRLVIQNVTSLGKNQNQEEVYEVHGVMDRTPISLADRVNQFFIGLERLEKIAEIVDECFHLFGSLLQSYSSVKVYQTLRNLHHAAHDVEHFLHAFCFLGDLSRLVSNRFVEYQDKERKKLDYLRSAARVCHAVAHFFTSAILLNELGLNLGRVEKLFKYAPVLSAFGYGIWTISLIWERYQKKVNEQFSWDLTIHLSGFLFEAFPFIKSVTVLNPYHSVIDKLRPLAGVIHAWNVFQRLTPQEQEKVSGRFEGSIKILPLIQQKKEENCQCAHNHDH